MERKTVSDFFYEPIEYSSLEGLITKKQSNPVVPTVGKVGTFLKNVPTGIWFFVSEFKSEFTNNGNMHMFSPKEFWIIENISGENPQVLIALPEELSSLVQKKYQHCKMFIVLF